MSHASQQLDEVLVETLLPLVPIGPPAESHDPGGRKLVERHELKPLLVEPDLEHVQQVFHKDPSRSGLSVQEVVRAKRFVGEVMVDHSAQAMSLVNKRLDVLTTIGTAAPLLGMFCFGNLMRECGVVDRLSDTAQNALINITTIFLGLSVGSKLSADKFLDKNTLGILLLGIVAFSIGTACGVLMAKLMNKLTKTPINPNGTVMRIINGVRNELYCTIRTKTMRSMAMNTDRIT